MKDLTTIENASDAELAEAGIDDVVRAIGRVAQECAEFDSIDESERKTLMRCLAALDRVTALKSGAESDGLLLVRMMVLGKLGDFETAVSEATKAHQAHSTWHTAVTVANAWRRAGDLNRAIEMWSEAAELDPHDVTALLEIGDSYIEMEDWEQAIGSYERAMEREPEQAWAVPSIHYCRYRLTGDRNWLRSLQRRAHKSPDECGVENVLAQLAGSYSSDMGIQRAQQLLELIPGTE